VPHPRVSCRSHPESRIRRRVERSTSISWQKGESQGGGFQRCMPSGSEERNQYSERTIALVRVDMRRGLARLGSVSQSGGGHAGILPRPAVSMKLTGANTNRGATKGPAFPPSCSISGLWRILWRYLAQLSVHCGVENAELDGGDWQPFCRNAHIAVAPPLNVKCQD
jgi:hypothetical protein